MNIKLIEINNKNNDYNKVIELYLKAFPENERMPVEMFTKKILEYKAKLLGIYDKDLWVGFCYVVEYKEITYLFFFAIDDKYRSKGYGSKTLELLLKRYPNLLLLIEEVDPKYDNYNQRVNRLNFYLHNGLHKANYLVDEAGVIYEMLTSSNEYYQEYIDLMHYFMGKEYDEFRNYDVR